MDIQTARKILGKIAVDLTDDEVQEIIGRLSLLAKELLELPSDGTLLYWVH